MRRAFTLIELLCTIAIIALLAALLLPVISRAYGQVRRTGCANNLKNIGTAFHAWAHEHNDLFPMQVSTNAGGTREFADATILNPDVSLTFRHFQALSNELVVAKLLRCPADPFRAPADDFSSLRGSNVSYWINVKARFGDTESPITGDRNVRTSGRMAWTFVQFSADDVLEFSADLHGARGNVLFGDGHVSALDGTTLRARLNVASNGGFATLSLPREDVPAFRDAAPQTLSQSTGPAGRADPSSSANEGNAVTNHQRTESTHSQATATTATSNVMTALTGTKPVRLFPPANGDATPLIITKLDGTIVTSTVPRALAQSARESTVPAERMNEMNPIVEFVQWLIRTAAKHTYTLLFLLLVALIAFEIARRRAQRKRSPSSE